MGFPKVKSFFGLSLHTGTFIIAGLSLVGNIVCFFFFLYTLVMDLRFRFTYAVFRPMRCNFTKFCKCTNSWKNKLILCDSEFHIASSEIFYFCIPDFQIRIWTLLSLNIFRYRKCLTKMCISSLDLNLDITSIIRSV